MSNVIQSIPVTTTGHPAWCDTTDSVHDVHQFGAGCHASTIRSLGVEVGGRELTGGIWVQEGGPAQIRLGDLTYMTPQDARTLAANLARLADEADGPAAA